MHGLLRNASSWSLLKECEREESARLEQRSRVVEVMIILFIAWLLFFFNFLRCNELSEMF